MHEIPSLLQQKQLQLLLLIMLLLILDHSIATVLNVIGAPAAVMFILRLFYETNTRHSCENKLFVTTSLGFVPL